MDADNYISKVTISDYLGALSSKTPTPGGGSAAALVGTTGLSLLNMCIKFSIKRVDESEKERLEDYIKECDKLTVGLSELIEKDMICYNEVRKASKANKDIATHKSCKVLLDIMDYCNKALCLFNDFKFYCSPYMVSDLLVTKKMILCSYDSARDIITESLENNYIHTSNLFCDISLSCYTHDETHEKLIND